ncbi:lipase [Devosia sp. Root685]|uniref:GDSL-type esterase/lipase family protein n=1 Tax=Devosia sp. Root685 TaxID=1736587 RepID=UPI0006FF8E0E|nr:GDSL-type esterase/lipase family protein [Devosia sp. Root685]KRA96794.1 lipase [Devosia sp. Root685]
MKNFPITESLVFGAQALERTETGLQPHRLPASARRQNEDAGFSMAERQPSGVRLKFRTAASAIELDVLPTKRVYTGMPERPDGVYDLVVDGALMQQKSALGGRIMRIGMAPPSMVLEPGAVQVLRFENLPAGEKLVEIWLPHDEMTELVALRADADLLPVPARKIWLHHGSSISQGSNATSPTGIWPAVAAALGEVDLINMGFGGNALLDPFTARAMRDTKADLVSVKMGINLVNLDLMRLRAFGPALHGFLDTIREGHPKTPLLVVSPIYCPIHETTPGPGQFDFAALAEGRLLFRAEGNPEEAAKGKLTLVAIRRKMEEIVAQRAASDPNIHYLDGLALYGEADNARLALPDALHPDGAIHALMGQRFAQAAFSGVFSEIGRG